MPVRKKYCDELRERAGRLAFDSQRPIAHVARDLGMHPETLRLSVRQAEADAGTRNDRLTTEERERLKALEPRAPQDQRDSQGRGGVFREGLDGTPRR
jgi:transposase